VFDFVDEALDILDIFTEKRVTQLAWQGFDALYTAFNMPNSEASAATCIRATCIFERLGLFDRLDRRFQM
jgi:hypothetical protein